MHMRGFFMPARRGACRVIIRGMYPIDLPARLILLPGLGANHKLFGPQKQVFRDHLQTPDFIVPSSPAESIGSYAARWAPLLRAEAGLKRGDDRPVIVGGTSIGGMVAMEMARAIGARGVILIGSARRGDAVPTRARIMDLLGKPVPTSLTPKLLLAGALPLALLNELDDDAFKLLKDMANDADPRVVKWGLGAMADWEFDGRIDVPVFQIHGGHDRMLPPTGDADQLIRDGGHFINLTHPQTVNRFIADTVEKITGTAPTPVV